MQKELIPSKISITALASFQTKKERNTDIKHTANLLCSGDRKGMGCEVCRLKTTARSDCSNSKQQRLGVEDGSQPSCFFAIRLAGGWTKRHKMFQKTRRTAIFLRNACFGSTVCLSSLVIIGCFIYFVPDTCAFSCFLFSIGSKLL